MNSKTYVERLLPLLGGEANLVRQTQKDGCFLFTVKDSGVVCLAELRQMDGVAAVELNRGRVRVTAQANFVEDIIMATKTNKYEAIAPQMLELTGGTENIASFVHCATRLRFNVKDKSKVNADKIGKLPGCMGTNWANNQLQVIIGPAVDQAYDAVCAAGGLQKEASIDENLDEGKKKLSVSTVCEAISGCIVPLIPLFMATGLLKVVVVLGNLVGLLPSDGSTYNILTYAADAGLYFMPIFIGYAAAKKFGADPSLAMGLCALLVYPNFMTAITGETTATIFGIPIYSATYSNMFFPSILVVLVMSYVERFIKKHVPDILRVMLVPLLTALIMLPLELCLLAPLGVFLGNGITWLVETIYNSIGFIGVGILSGIYPVLVVTGMHSTLATACTAYFVKYQYDPLILPACHISNFDSAAAAFGVMLKSKNPDIKGVAGSSALTALLAGVTEPALFGINFRYRTPLIAEVIGGFVGGCYVGIMGCKLVAVSGLGIFALSGFITSDIMNLVNYVIGILIAMAVTCIITFITFKDPIE